MTNKCLRYELLRAKSCETLSEMVSARLAKGWELYGHPSHSDYYNDIWHSQYNIVMSKCEHIYIQAVTKESDDNALHQIRSSKKAKARREAE